MKYKYFAILAILLVLVLSACAGAQGPAGPQGPEGPAGPEGPQGSQGEPGIVADGLTEEQLAALESAAVLSGIAYPSLTDIRRGCTACHVLRDEEVGKYTLAYEAHVRSEAAGGVHPNTAADGTSMLPTDEVPVTVCLQCHASGTGDREGKGALAPLSLQDIVHPAHMFSSRFSLVYLGNCFSCHNVDSQGAWDLLSEKVETDEKGVPNPDNLPIPGAIPIQ